MANGRMTILRWLILAACGFALLGCEGFPASRPVINSGSYDWTDQVRGPNGYPLPGWGNIVFGGGGLGDDSR